MQEPIERARVAVNTMRARLTILGFNLAITTFQISNARGLGGGSHFEGFQTTVHLSAGTVLVAGVALSIAAMVAFIASAACQARRMATPNFSRTAGKTTIAASPPNLTTSPPSASTSAIVRLK